jgi:hypothetical protein
VGYFIKNKMQVANLDVFGSNDIQIKLSFAMSRAMSSRAAHDALSAPQLVSMLVRYHAGEKKVWSVVRVPGAADKDPRHLHRELIAVQDERTKHVNRI